MGAEPTGSSNGQPRTRRERGRLVALIVIAVVLTVFVLSNTKTVTIDWVVGSTRAPLILALGVAVLLGAALGAIATRRDGRGGRRDP